MHVSVRMLSVSLAVTFALLVAPAAPAAARGHRSKLDHALRDALAEGPSVVRVIVQTAPGTRPLVKKTLQVHGAVVAAEYPSLDALAVDLHVGDLRAVEADPNVLVLSIDAEVTSFGGRDRKVGNSAVAADLLRTVLGLDSVGYTGEDVRVAIVDSGIEPDRDLLPRLRGFWDFTRGGIPMVPYDDYGHGTHLAGLIASSGQMSSGKYRGVAPGVQLFGLKVLDRNGRGRTSDVVKALEWLVANKNLLRIDIINLSLGHPIYEPASTDPLVIAVENAIAAGYVVVTAAGNLGVDKRGEPGYAGITSPGNAPSAITVGAVDSHQTAAHGDDRIAYFSSRGPSWFDSYAKPDVVAPGVALTANAAEYGSLYYAYPGLITGKGRYADFATLSGTSMAAAVTTGVAALVLEASRTAHPGSARLTAHTVKGILQYSALPVRGNDGEPYDALSQGTGEINAPGALAMGAAIDPAAPLGSSWVTAPLLAQTTIGGETLAWSQRLLWDENIVWGTGAMWQNSVVWSDASEWGTGLACDAGCENIVWGTGAPWAADLVCKNRIIGQLLADENIVWGTLDGLTGENIVWGTLIDGENIVWGTFEGENIVWGTFDGENIVWGTLDDLGENIVWGTLGGGNENLVWGTFDSSDGGDAPQRKGGR